MLQNSHGSLNSLPKTTGGKDKTVTTTSGDVETGDDLDVGYTTRVLIQALFPYRRPQHKEITVQSGLDQISIISLKGLPYGKYARLIMVYIITQAIFRQNLPLEEGRRIPMGRSMNEFLRRMGVKGRGDGRNLARLREQLNRIATSTITVEKVFNPNRDIGVNTQIVKSWDLWFSTNPEQMSLEESYIELTEEFFKEIITHPIPIDLNTFTRLSKPRSMDIYIWATARKYSLKNSGSPLKLSWEQLQQQFGPDTPNTARGKADFKRDFVKAVEDVVKAWPEAGITVDKAGLSLLPGQTHIPRKRKQKEL